MLSKDNIIVNIVDFELKSTWWTVMKNFGAMANWSKAQIVSLRGKVDIE
jgi:hypothetical protein